MAETENRPVSQVDLERRLEADHLVASNVEDSPVEVGRYAVEGNDLSNYVGVSDEYRTYANEGEKPYPFGGVEGKSVKATGVVGDVDRVKKADGEETHKVSVEKKHPAK